ncbi:MAG: class IV adenylate cyclase [Pyrinomonadaceae bacterium]
MGTEIEKKYQLSEAERERLLARLSEEPAAVFRGEEREENVLFSGPNINHQTSVLRLRIVDGRAILTYKERLPHSASAIRRQREDETEVSSVPDMIAILEGIGYRPSLVYEKRRRTWSMAGVELVIDELPFGLFAEIEGEEQLIIAAEMLLGLQHVRAEMETYPELTAKYGAKIGGMIESRF